jgi:hypothetical protein
MFRRNVLHLSSGYMEQARSYETLLHVYQTTRRNIPEGPVVEYLKFHKDRDNKIATNQFLKNDMATVRKHIIYV